MVSRVIYAGCTLLVVHPAPQFWGALLTPPPPHQLKARLPQGLTPAPALSACPGGGTRAIKVWGAGKSTGGGRGGGGGVILWLSAVLQHPCLLPISPPKPASNRRHALHRSTRHWSGKQAGRQAGRNTQFGLFSVLDYIYTNSGEPVGRRFESRSATAGSGLSTDYSFSPDPALDLTTSLRGDFATDEILLRG